MIDQFRRRENTTLFEFILSAGPGTMTPHGHGESICENFPSFIPHDPHSAVIPQTSMLKALSLSLSLSS